MSALTKQVDGSHYITMVVQPLELSYLLARGDASFCKLVKYITRDKGERSINLEKAAHVVSLYGELYVKYNFNPLPPLSNKGLKLLEIMFDNLRSGDLCESICISFIEGNLQQCIELIDQLAMEDSLYGS